MINAQIIGEIEDLTDVFTMIDDAQEDVELLINSPGGDAMEAMQLVNAIEKCQHEVTAHVEVQAMSAAAVIALGCPKVTMDSKAIVMLHNCWTFAIGNAKDMQNEVDAMHAVDNALQEIVTAHCSEENAAFIKSKMDDGELWLTGKQCAELFDNVILLEKPHSEAIAAGGSLADLVEKYNTLLAMFNEQKEGQPAEGDAEPTEEETPAEEPAQEETPEEETSEPEPEPEPPVQPKEDYVVPDNIRAILDEVL